MRDRIVQDRVHKDRDQFIQSINEDDICRLASSYHSDDPCAFFKPPARGSYNICFFVRFHSCSTDETSDTKGQACQGGDSWVVRVPLSPYLAIPAHDKLESEVAVMQLIATKTTIPIPKLYAYSFAREKGPYGVASFIILEYIEGQTLNEVEFKNITDDQRQNLYVQLADIYIQLRRLEFPATGRLAPCPNGAEVRKKPISNDINMQEVEGLQSFRILAEYGSDTGALTSANDYVSMLLRIARNAFMNGRKNVYSEADGSDSLYHLDQFSKFVETRWLNPALNSGPFVLVHGDLKMYNLMVNENLDILAVLDWEWSLVVPLQFFIPPTWITNRPIVTLSWDFFYDDYIKKLDKLRAIVRDRELKMYGEELLSKDWANVHENAGILVSSALESWTNIDYVARRYLDEFLYQRKDLDDRIRQFMREDPSCGPLIARKVADHRRKDLDSRIQQFMKEDPSRGALIAWKMADYMAYRAERKRLGIEDSEDDEQEKWEEQKANNGGESPKRAGGGGQRGRRQSQRRG